MINGCKICIFNCRMTRKRRKTIIRKWKNKFQGSFVGKRQMTSENKVEVNEKRAEILKIDWQMPKLVSKHRKHTHTHTQGWEWTAEWSRMKVDTLIWLHFRLVHKSSPWPTEGGTFFATVCVVEWRSLWCHMRTSFGLRILKTSFFILLHFGFGVIVCPGKGSGWKTHTHTEF